MAGRPDGRGPEPTVLLFNDCINSRDLEGLSGLMTEDHAFVDRVGERHEGRSCMIEGWRAFFREFPDYRNTITGISTVGDLVIATGCAEWTEGGEPDRVIWTARVRDGLVAEWRVMVDCEENRALLGMIREGVRGAGA